MNVTMRNSNSDPSHRTLEKKLNHHIKSLVKLPSQSFGKESIFHKLIDLGENKKEGTYTTPNRNIIVEHTRFVNKISKTDENDKIKLSKSNDNNVLVNLACPKSLKDYEASFLYSENIKSSMNVQSVNLNNSKNKYRKGNIPSSAGVNSVSKMVIEKSKDINMMERNNADSRVTGGGTTQKANEDCVGTKPKLKISERHSQNAPLTKKNSKDLNPSRKVSFKVKNPASVHRKTVLTSNKVAALTQKFNELIKENDNLVKESKVAIIHDNTVPNHKIHNSDISTSTFTLPSNVNVKIKTYNKISIKRRTSVKSKSSSNASLDNVHISESPILHRKLTRVKSDCLPKKKSLSKKKSQEVNKKVDLSHFIKPNNISNEIKDKNDTEMSELTEVRKPKQNVKRKPSFKTSPTRHSVNVRAAIQKFETTKPAPSTADDKTAPSDNIKIVENAGKNSVNKLDMIKDALQKPKVPEKKINLLKTKNLVMRDGKAKIKNIKCNSVENQTIPVEKEDLTTSPQVDFIPSPQKKIIPNIQKDEITKHARLSANENIKIKKGFVYEKVKFPQTFLNQSKLQLSNSTDICLDTPLCTPMIENWSIQIIEADKKSLVNVDDKTDCTVNGDVKSESLTDDEKLYQEVSARIKPNDSFLWRSNSKIDLLPLKEYEVKKDFSSENENIYDFVGPSTASSECVKDSETNIAQEETICPSFETLIKKADDLLDNKKREIAEDLKKEKNNPAQDFYTEVFNLNIKYVEEIVETVNVVAIDDSNNIAKQEYQQTLDEGYEPLEPYRSNLGDSQKSLVDVLNKSHNKSNCPLPEVPHEKEHNVYKYLFKEVSHRDEDCSSNHSYEYCAGKISEEQFYNNDSDDGYEYCKCSKENLTIKREESSNKEISPEVIRRSKEGYSSLKSRSPTSSIGYEKISSIYESIPPKMLLELQYSKHCISNESNYEHGINYDECNCEENIYDTIKPCDTISESNCYESIPGSPHSVVKMRQKLNTNKYQTQLLPKHNIPFDAISNFSQSYSGSTISSENKTNSIYGQRSIVSSVRSETTIYGNAPSEISSSDRSDDWIDMSDQEESAADPNKNIKRERSRGKRSPASWSRKVRHQWTKTSQKRGGSGVFVSSPSAVYISTSRTATFYSDNDDVCDSLRNYQNVDVVFRIIKDAQLSREDLVGLAVFRVYVCNDDSTETQEATILIDVDSSDSEHLYEPFPHQGLPEDSRLAHEYYDSFDSDSESEHNSVEKEPFHHVHKGDIDNTQLPEPPSSSNIYTLTRFASAAGKKMRELKRNFTKSTRKKSTSDIGVIAAISIEEKDPSKIKRVNEQKSKKFKENVKTIPDYTSQNIVSSVLLKCDEANVEKFQKAFKKQHSSPCGGSPSEFPVRNALSNIHLNNPSKINSELVHSSPKSEQKYVNVSNSNVESQEAQNNNSKMEKDSGTLSRKSYLSFKSKFKRNSTFTEGNKSRSQSLSVMNSTFYLNDLLNDSTEDKSNESLASEIYKEESQPIPPTRKHNRKSTPERILTDSSQVNETDIPTVAINVKKTSPVSGNKSYSSVKSPAVRPNAPPPPPPDTGSPTSGDPKRQSASKKDKRALNSTSWYAECGLFKANEQYKPETNGNTKERTSSTSWYAEVGLYQIGNVSTSSGASSTLSGGGTCSTTTTAPSPPDTPVPPLGMFNQEPLYQFYDAAKLESVCREIGNYSDSDGYEEIANFKEGVPNGKPVQRPSAMTLVSPQKGPSRTLWCEIPEVINSAILNTLSPTQKKLQEAMFEIISSEASYLNSLTVLESIFMSHPAFEDERIVSNEDKNILFGNIPPVKRCSEQLLADLEQCWQENILLRGLCKIVRNHAEKNFHVYVKYCESQVFLVKTLKKLKMDPKFNDILNQIESQPACQCLCLHSFLMLPMQRATRLPLLMDAVLKKLTASDDEYQPCLDALATLNNIVSQCNEGARNVERIEEIRILSSQIEFPPHIKEIPIITLKKNSVAESQRWLVRSGELTQLLWRGDDQSKLTFGRKVTKITLHLFLFTDLLVVTKKKSDESYVVIDYCKRSLLEITSSDMMGASPIKESAGKYTLLLTMLENYENKTVEMLLSCVSESDRQRWMEACLPPPSDNPDETVYEGWDCPQVAAVFCYQSTQPDELNLQKGDIVNVNKKMADGWHHGERIRDGEKGWFPGTYTVEIASPHVRARNLRQRYRLLALTGNYLGQNKKK